MNICFVSQEYPPETAWGGIGTYVYEMARSLAIKGHCVIVLARGTEAETYRLVDGVHVYRIPQKWNLGDLHVLWRFQRYLTGYRAAVAGKLDELVKKYDLDVIESPEIYADLLFYQVTRKERPAIVIKLHTPRRLVDKAAKTRPELWNRFEYWTESLTIKRADEAYSCSRALLNACKDFLPKRDYQVVHNPITIPEALPSRDDDGKTILFVGRLEWHKGVQVFGRTVPGVLGKMRNARFVFLGPDRSWHGGDSLKDHILNQVPKSMRHALSFPGSVSRQEVMDNLRRASVVVLPSLWENFPYTCLEAMACGCAVVGSRNGGMAEMIEDGVSGILIDPGKPEQVTDAVLLLLGDRALRQRLGEKAAMEARGRFSADRIADQTLEIYRRAMDIHNGKKVS